ncbi:S-phase kinase-associated protein 1 [Drosophila pseudoobscura]|uniref:S-phase kinase-associated protein 1 n=1 Tax=Drosophila pseudoobscura pseudoobscura TaxID=46245 RepID=A0A6I8V495_DROPS|nr:S-phase kinase-associated protein 1 [Drosophila pseudoobscura]
MPLVRLESSDGVVFDTDADTAKCSGTIKNMLEDCGLEHEEDHDHPIIPVPHVNSTILKMILTWAKYHMNDVPPAKDADKKDGKMEEYPICEWDADFFSTVDHGTLFELIIAANYLDIRGLMNSACQTVANMIKGHTPEQIRLIFNIPREPTEKDLYENHSVGSSDSEEN